MKTNSGRSLWRWRAPFCLTSHHDKTPIDKEHVEMFDWLKNSNTCEYVCLCSESTQKVRGAKGRLISPSHRGSSGVNCWNLTGDRRYFCPALHAIVSVFQFSVNTTRLGPRIVPFVSRWSYCYCYLLLSVKHAQLILETLFFILPLCWLCCMRQFSSRALRPNLWPIRASLLWLVWGTHLACQSHIAKLHHR